MSLAERIRRLDEYYLAADAALTRWLRGIGSWGFYLRARRRYERLRDRR